MSRPRSERLRIPEGGATAMSPYPDFDVAAPDKWALDWDEKTRRVVRERVEQVPRYRFFSVEEARTIEAICARILPQDDRPLADRVPLAPWIDARLHDGTGDGYRYEDMPDDRDAYRFGLRGCDEAATQLHGQAFADLGQGPQDDVLTRLAAGEAPGDAWAHLPARRFFQELAGEVIATYYAHPTAWAEIGFSGPASPRGHIRLDLGRHDPWEATERRPRSSTDIVHRALERDHQDEGGAHSSGGPTH
ncbi:MAG: gluconate 2-dehydrogenase subunit 3 family protein [Chloroflexota bacterium]|nr:gluconate 2-dehydrogenase subunit 3 family protein [Chloroflexota bacterium]